MHSFLNKRNLRCQEGYKIVDPGNKYLSGENILINYTYRGVLKIQLFLFITSFQFPPMRSAWQARGNDKWKLNFKNSSIDLIKDYFEITIFPLLISTPCRLFASNRT